METHTMGTHTNHTDAYHAVVAGLVLAVTAPTNTQAEQALAVTAEIAATLTAGEVEAAKRDAEKILRGGENK